MFPLRFDVAGTSVEVPVRTLLNAGYAGRSQDDVAAHVAELAELGVPAPTRTPCLYPVAPYLAMQTADVPVQHARTSGEAEWALIIAGPREEDVLLTAACDHTDRSWRCTASPGASKPGRTCSARVPGGWSRSPTGSTR